MKLINNHKLVRKVQSTLWNHNTINSVLERIKVDGNIILILC